MSPMLGLDEEVNPDGLTVTVKVALLVVMEPEEESILNQGVELDKLKFNVPDPPLETACLRLRGSTALHRVENKILRRNHNA